MAYNINWLDRAGLAEPSDNWTWGDWVDYARRLSDPENERWGTTVATSAWTWMPFLWQNGGEFFNADRTEARFHSPEGIEALQLQVDMIHTYQAARPIGASGGFNNERVAMDIAGPWNLRPWREQLSFEYSVAFLPGQVERASNLGGEGFVILAGSTEQAEAYKLIEYLTTTPEIAIGFAQRWWTIPPLREAALNPATWLDPNLETFVRQMEYARSRPFVPNWENVRTIIAEAIDSALRQEVNPRTALEAAAARMNVLLEEVNR